MSSHVRSSIYYSQFIYGMEISVDPAAGPFRSHLIQIYPVFKEKVYGLGSRTVVNIVSIKYGDQTFFHALSSALDKLWVNWVFTQPGYPQLRTCKNNCVFSYIFLRHVFFL